MTANQIRYQELLETKRNNRANLSETNRHNVTTEGIQATTNEVNWYSARNLANYNQTMAGIAQQNANTAQQTADANDRSVTNKYVIDTINSRTSARNASTNEKNANTNRAAIWVNALVGTAKTAADIIS